MLNWSASPLSKVLDTACIHIGVVIGVRVVGEVHVGKCWGREGEGCVCVCAHTCMRTCMRVCQEQVEYTLLQLKKKEKLLTDKWN